ncbi:RidA family protein [Curtobacterium pusillum]|uniref:RidA family protein n=1 Tax=Curtobacterium pusillum TaxID=69373 RepID=UPI0011A98AEA|nr:RidA family protein [Curtobacterium pusillum]
MSGARIDPAAVKQQPYYTHAVARLGQPVFLTGQVAWDVDGTVVGIGDIETQVMKAWANLEAVLADLNATVGDIVKLTTYATDRAFIPSIHRERAKRYTTGHYPASTFIHVAGLAHPDLMVEIEAIVILPNHHPIFARSN